MNTFFQKLGRTVFERWKRDNFSLAKFPEIARAALDERPPATHVRLSELMRDFLVGEDQPPQTDSEFGEPEIVVYSHSRFYIQLLFWMDGTTAIHQHEFSGAFHVMHGSSIHAHYEFEKGKSITPYLRVGNVRLKEIELLETGRTMAIASGPQAIHSLFHLDSPSVTVVVRTQHDPGTGPQFNYLPPHVAFDPHFSDTLTMRRKQLLDVLEYSGDSGYVDRVKEMVDDLDFERGFSILHHTRTTLQQLEQWQPVLSIFEKKHGVLARGIGVTLDEDGRRNFIKGLRGTLLEPEHRFFLALLMNAPTREDVFALIAQRFTHEAPADIIVRWAGELIGLSDDETGVAILDAVFPDSVEVDLDAQSDLFFAAFEHFVKRGKKIPPALRGRSTADMKALRGAFTESALGVLARE